MTIEKERLLKLLYISDLVREFSHTFIFGIFYTVRSFIKWRPALASCSITLPNELSYIPAALAFLRELSAKTGFDEHDQRQIELAMEEIITLVITHAFPNAEIGTFDIHIDDDVGGISVTILDKGLPWDPDLDDRFVPNKTLEKTSAEGLSHYLIERLTDRFEFSNQGREGKTTRFIKYLRKGLIGEDRPDISPEIPTPPQKQQQAALNFDIRLALPEEAIEICRAVYDCYGYSYAGDYVYYPERIIAMNKSGALRSAVAVVESTQEVGGHFALIFREALPPEIGIAVTKQKFRGYGFARSLGEFLEQQAKTLSYAGLQVKEVTSHPYTQKFCAKLGYVDTGFLLAHSPKTLSFKGIKDNLKQRNSDVLGFKYIQTPQQKEVYLPPQHANILTDIYAQLGVSITPGSDTPMLASGTLLQVNIDSIRSVCDIQIVEYGDDFEQAIKQELRRIRRKEIQVVELYLPISVAAAPQCINIAETINFFFTGLLPETKFGDAVVMQYLNGVQVEYKELVIERQHTRQLLAYVAAQDPANQ